jgi:hypothetical protein
MDLKILSIFLIFSVLEIQSSSYNYSYLKEHAAKLNAAYDEMMENLPKIDCSSMLDNKIVHFESDGRTETFLENYNLALARIEKAVMKG